MKMSPSQKARAIEDLKILNAIPPYNDGSNICAFDGYFAQSLERKYRMNMSGLEKLTGFDEITKRWAKACRKLDKQFS